MNIQQATPEFNAAMFWADKPIKKFVCTLRENGISETRVYGASNSDRAAELAMSNTDLDPEQAFILDIHLATPEELDCVPAVSVPRPLSKVEKIEFQCQQLAGALAQCLNVMKDIEKKGGLPLDNKKWVSTITNASTILKEGK